MDNLTYTVVENNNNNEKVEKFFNHNKEEAIDYYESRCNALDAKLTGWKKELGINSCIWSMGEQYNLIYIQMDGVEDIEI